MKTEKVSSISGENRYSEAAAMYAFKATDHLSEVLCIEYGFEIYWVGVLEVQITHFVSSPIYFWVIRTTGRPFLFPLFSIYNTSICLLTIHTDYTYI